jgi:dTMP kinase
MFFTIDGCDGTGKSTQITLLAQYLQELGHKVITCRDPGSTAVGEQVRDLLLHRHDLHITRRCEMLLYMAARAQLVDEIIRPALAAGKTVISDRFLLANVAYQGYGGGLDVEMLWQVGRVATAGVTPDLTLILDASTDVTAARINSQTDRKLDRMESQGLSFYDRVRKGYLAEAGRQSGQIVVIDADRAVECVQADIRLAAQRIIKHQAYGEMEDSPDAQAFGGLA